MIYHHPISRSELYWIKFLTGFVIACIPALTIAVSLGPHILNGIIESAPREMRSISGQSLSLFIQQGGAIFTLLFMLGLLPFFCAALITHSIQNPIYAFLESIPALAGVLCVFAYLQFLMYNLLHVIRWYDPRPFILPLPVFSWSLFLLLVGLALAGWRAATDRRLLTGTILARQISVARLFFFTLATVTILVKTGWKDLLYLVTNVNLGIG